MSEGRSAVLDADGALVECQSGRVRADEAEGRVIEALTQFAVPQETIEAARAELRERLKEPKAGTAEREMARLKTRLARLGDVYSWGDLSESEYRKERAGVEARLAELAEDDKVLLFDRHRAIVQSLPVAIAGATKDKVQELIAMVVERVETADRIVSRVVWTPAARPFFATEGPGAGPDAALFWRPRTDSNRRRRP